MGRVTFSDIWFYIISKRNGYQYLDEKNLLGCTNSHWNIIELSFYCTIDIKSIVKDSMILEKTLRLMGSEWKDSINCPIKCFRMHEILF